MPGELVPLPGGGFGVTRGDETPDDVLRAYGYTPAPPVGGKRKPFAAGFDAAATGLTAGLPYAVRQVTGGTTAREEYDYKQKLRESAARQQELLPGGPAWFDNAPLGQVIYENLAYPAPQMVAQVAGGLVGGAVGSLAGPGPGTAIGAGLGAGAVGSPFYVGSNVARATEDGQKNLTAQAAGRSIGIAGVQSLLDVPVAAFAPGVGKLIPGAGGFAGNVLTRAAKGAALAAPLEAGTEVLQQAGERYAAGLDLVSPDAGNEYFRAGTLGGLLGGITGGVGGPFNVKRTPAAVPTPTANAMQAGAPVDILQIGGPTYDARGLEDYGIAQQRANYMAAAPVGAQSDLFQFPLVEPEPVVQQEDMAAAPPRDNRTEDLFEYAPTAEVRSQFSPNSVVAAVREAVAPRDEAGNRIKNKKGELVEGKLDNWSLQLVNKVNNLIFTGNDEELAAYVDAAQETLQTAKLSGKTIAYREAALGAAAGIAKAHGDLMGTARGIEGLRTPPVAKEAPAIAEPPAPIPTPDALQPEAQFAQAAQTVADTERRDAQLSEDAKRQDLLDYVLNAPDTVDPVRRFVALLKRNGLEPTLRGYETKKIDSAVTFAAMPEPEPEFADFDPGPQEDGVGSLEAMIPERGTVRSQPQPRPAPLPKPEAPPLVMRTYSDEDIANIEAAAVRRAAKAAKLATAAADAMPTGPKQTEMFTPKGKVTATVEKAMKRAADAAEERRAAAKARRDATNAKTKATREANRAAQQAAREAEQRAAEEAAAKAAAQPKPKPKPAPAKTDAPTQPRAKLTLPPKAAAAADTSKAKEKPEATATAEPAEKVAEFKTAKGSTYKVNADGTTTRDKAARPEHPGKAERGPQPTSEDTFYATKEQADALAIMQAKGGPRTRVIRDRNSYAVEYVEGPDAGKLVKGSVITPSRTPAVGLLPVELWDGGKRIHFGNEIVSTSAAEPKAPPAAEAAKKTSQARSAPAAETQTTTAEKPAAPPEFKAPAGGITQEDAVAWATARANSLGIRDNDPIRAALADGARTQVQYKQGLLTPGAFNAKVPPDGPRKTAWLMGAQWAMTQRAAAPEVNATPEPKGDPVEKMVERKAAKAAATLEPAPEPTPAPEQRASKETMAAVKKAWQAIDRKVDKIRDDLSEYIDTGNYKTNKQIVAYAAKLNKAGVIDDGTLAEIERTMSDKDMGWGNVDTDFNFAIDEYESRLKEEAKAELGGGTARQEAVTRRGLVGGLMGAAATLAAGAAKAKTALAGTSFADAIGPKGWVADAFERGQWLYDADLSKAVAWVRDNSTNPAHRDLARLLMLGGFGKGATLSIAPPGAVFGLAGLTEFKGDHIAVKLMMKNGDQTAWNNGLSEETLLHEAIHAWVMARYEGVGTYLSRNLEILKIAPVEGEPFVAAFRELWRTVSGRLEKEFDFENKSADDPIFDDPRMLNLREAWGSPDELLVRVFVDPYTREWLKTHDMDGRVVKPADAKPSLWDKIVKFFGDMLGIKAAPTRAAFDELMDAGTRLLKAGTLDPADLKVASAMNAELAKETTRAETTAADPEPRGGLYGDFLAASYPDVLDDLDGEGYVRRIDAEPAIEWIASHPEKNLEHLSTLAQVMLDAGLGKGIDVSVYSEDWLDKNPDAEPGLENAHGYVRQGVSPDSRHEVVLAQARGTYMGDLLRDGLSPVAFMHEAFHAWVGGRIGTLRRYTSDQVTPVTVLRNAPAEIKQLHKLFREFVNMPATDHIDNLLDQASNLHSGVIQMFSYAKTNMDEFAAVILTEPYVRWVLKNTAMDGLPVNADRKSAWDRIMDWMASLFQLPPRKTRQVRSALDELSEAFDKTLAAVGRLPSDNSVAEGDYAYIESRKARRFAASGPDRIAKLEPEGGARPRQNIDQRQTDRPETDVAREIDDYLRASDAAKADKFSPEDYAKFRARLDALGLASVQLMVRKPVMGEKFTGYFGPNTKGQRLITLLLGNDGKLRTLNHEVIHALRDMGAFSDSEWASLTLIAKSAGTRLEDAKARYGGNIAYQNKDGSVNEDAIVEEVVADMFGDWAQKRATFPGRASALFDRIGRFFHLLHDTLRTGRGWPQQSLTQIFNDIDSGKIGARGNPSSQMREGPGRMSLGPTAQSAGNVLKNVIADRGQRYPAMAVMSPKLIEMGDKLGLTALRTYQRLLDLSAAVVSRHNTQFEQLSTDADALPVAARASANKLIETMTRKGLWAFNPGYLASPPQVDAALAAQFNAMPVKAQEAIKSAFSLMRQTLLEKKAAVMEAVGSEYDALIRGATSTGDTAEAARLTRAKAKELTRFRSLLSINEGMPYAPLRRFGDYVVVGTSQAYLDAVEAARSGTGTWDTVTSMQKDDRHYFVDFAENAAAQASMLARVTAAYDVPYAFKKDDRVDRGVGQPMFSIFQRLQKMIEDEELDPVATRRLQKMATEMYLGALAATSARKSELHRRLVASEDLDMMRGIIQQGRADAHFIGAVKNNSQVLDALAEAKQQAEVRGATADERAQNATMRGPRQAVLNEVLLRHAANLDQPPPNTLVDAATSLTSMWMLSTSPSYFLQQALQPMVFSVPAAAARYGYGPAMSTLMKGYKQIVGAWGGSGVTGPLDIDQLDEQYRPLAHFLAERNRLDVGIDKDMGSWTSGGDNPAAVVWRTIDGKLRGITRKAEMVNRLSTAVMVYDLELAATAKAPVNFDPGAYTAYRDDFATAHPDLTPMTPEQFAAANQALKLIDDTHGDYSTASAPRFLRGNFARLITQFRKFQIMTVTLYAQSIKDAFFAPNIDPVERAVARRTIAYLLGHAALFAGAVGLPGAMMAMAVLEAVLDTVDDDEPHDVEEMLRKAIGNDAIADLLLKGAPTLAGLDLSGSLGQGASLSLAPYSDPPLDRQGYEKYVFALTGPAIGGVGANLFKGIGLMREGEYYKGLEAMMPKGIANGMRSYREGTEGITNVRGDVLDQVDAYTTAAGVLGLRTSRRADQQEAVGRKIELDTFFKRKGVRVKRAYVEAVRKNDTVAQTRLRAQWMALQEARAEKGYAKQPLSMLLRAPAAQTKKEARTVEGIQFSPGNADAAEELADIYGLSSEDDT